MLVEAIAYTFTWRRVMPDGKPYDRKDFINIFNGLARHRHRCGVFRDFLTMSVISLHNAAHMDDELER
jgi:hypothetical protein